MKTENRTAQAAQKRKYGRKQKEDQTMKTMKKTMGWLVMAAALTVGMASCSNADSITEEPVQQPENPAKKTYTLTVQASKGGDNALTRALAEAGMTEGATTRALSLSSDGKTINASWEAGETVKVGIWNQPTLQYDFHGTLTAQSSGPTTTLTGTVTDISVNDELYLVFHADADYTEQGGTLQYIADNLDNDLAIVTVKSIDGAGNITINEDAAVFSGKNQAVVRFTLVDQADPTKRLKPSSLTISATDEYSAPVTYTLTALTDATYAANAYAEDNGDGVLYAAIKGMVGTDFTLTATMSYGDTYQYVRPSATFANGKFYSIKVNMLPTVMTGNIDLSKLTGNTTVTGEATLSGTLGRDLKVSIADGATVTLDGVTINGTNSSSYRWAGLNCLGDATIVLANGSTNTMKGFYMKVVVNLINQKN